MENTGNCIDSCRCSDRPKVLAMKKLFFIFVFLGGLKSFSQPIPPFKPLRYDEDYSFLKKDTAGSWYERMKFSPLSEKGDIFLSYGGEIRFQYFYTRNEKWGDEQKDKDGYVFTRWLAHADLRIGKHFRTFVQLQSSLANGRPSTSPVDENPLDLHQLFGDIITKPSANASLVFRMGRQEFLYGSQRLISVRDGPNNRQSFDGLKAMYSSGNYKIDLFYSHFVATKKKIFDDTFNNSTKLWGAYITRNKLPVVKNVDLYYLGLWKRKAMFDDGIGKELRHSIGTRLWNNKNNWQYDIEALYQFGKFSGKTIAAWTASLSTSYRFSKVKLKPEIGLKTELISGDKKYDDTRLQTFNPLFPRGAYFGLAALIGPANLIDIHPSLSFTLSDKLNFDIDYDVFWRYSRNDGIYAVNVAMIYPGRNTIEKHIGRQLTGTLLYRPNNFLYFRSEFTWFDAGGFLKEAGAGRDIIFSGITAQLKF